MNDLKFAIRQLRKRPGGTVIILVTLSLVIGTMSLVLGILQHERTVYMPFPEPERVVRLWMVTQNGPNDSLPAEVYADAAKSIQSLESIGAMGYYDSQVLTDMGEPKSISVRQVSPSLFDVAGVSPILGRTFTSEEVRSGADHLLVISHSLWQSDFNGETSIVGREITLNDRPVTIIGVMPEGFEHSSLFYGLEAWLPKDFESSGQAAGWLEVVGRMKPEVSRSKLNAELSTVLPPLLEAHADKMGWDRQYAAAMALRVDKRPGLNFEPEHVFGIAVPVFVLGIAAFNIANILLARMLSRRHEFAVRFTLGAKRARIIRQLLAESLLLASIGAGVGIVVSIWITGITARHGIHAEFNGFVLLGTLAFAVIAGLAVGALPAWRSTRGDLVTDLKDTGGVGGGGNVKRHRLRNFLTVGQVAMAAALCLGAGLLLRSYQNKKSYTPAFDPANFATIHSSLNNELYSTPEDRELYGEQVRERIEAIPGVREVSFASDRVLNRYPFPIGFRREGQDSWQRGQRICLTVTSPNHLPLINVPVIRGRHLKDSDRRGAPPVLVVNQSFVNEYFPDENPLGKRIGITLRDGLDWLEIVGVVPDRPSLGSKEDFGPEGYLSADQFFPVWANLNFLIQAQANPAPLRDAIRDAVKSVDPNVPVGRVSALQGEIDRALARNVGVLRTVAVIAVFGFAMAMIGIYGVVSYSVSERRYELGVRMALGANRGDLLRLVLRQGMRYAGIGLGIGLILGGLTTLGIRESLFGIGTLDWVTYGGVCLLLVFTALLASWFPAKRAANTNPMQALRTE